MPRRARQDGVNTWHHLANRGIAKRTLFEYDQDFRMFLALLAREVRRGRIEVHAYSLMHTHFHLLVRSVKGQLSLAMRAIQLGYSRWFNRTRRRDGPLYRGRFLSERIHGLEYRRNVTTYIHDNPVKAKMVAEQTDYAWSSATHIASEDRPKWLSTDWIDDELERRGGEGTREEQLAAAFGSRLDPEFRRGIEKRLRNRIPESMEEENAAQHYVRDAHTMRWMIRKAKLADGTRPWQPAVKRANVLGTVIQLRVRIETQRTRNRSRLWRRITGLLYRMSGLTQRVIACLLGCNESTVSRDMRDHRHWLEHSEQYEHLVAHAVATARQAA